jgi:RimJ/RimL family protein N-acetyltransferase
VSGPEPTVLAADGPLGHMLTERLDLRAVDVDDVAALHRFTSDPRYSEYLPGGLQETPEETRAWIERFRGRWEVSGLSYWTIRLRSDRSVIGMGGVERRAAFWNLFYLLDASQWGRGYATELGRAAQRAAAEVDPGLPFVAWIHEDNVTSHAVARRLGLTDYGLLEADHWNGQPMHYWADREPLT